MVFVTTNNRLSDVSIYMNSTVLIYKTLKSTENCERYIRAANEKKTEMIISELSKFDCYKMYPLNKIYHTQ
jgi:hypothetical protein